MKLTEINWRSINDYLLRTGSTCSLGDIQQKLLDGIQTLINYDCSNFFLHHQNGNSLNKPYTVNIEPEAVSDYINYYQFIDSIKEKTFDLPYPVKSTDIIDYSEWKQSEYFNDFLKPNQIYYTCGADIHYRGHLLATLSFFRDRHSPDFSAGDLKVLEILTPHLANQLHKLLLIEDMEGIKTPSHTEILKNQGKKYNFTPRETEVMELILKGSNNKEIAEKLYISINTVKKHVNRLLTKTGTRNRTELTAKVLKIKI